MRTPRTFGALALMTVLALAGCSSDEPGAASEGGSSTTTAGGPTSSSGPAPRRVVDVRAEGFTIEVPETWKDVVIDAAALQRLADQGGGSDAAVTAQIRVLAQRNGKLFAYDDSKRTTNLNVLKIPSVSGATIDQLLEGLAGQLTAQNLRDVKVEAVTLPGGRSGAKASGTSTVDAGGGKTAELFQMQYYALSGSFTFVAILATDDPARDQATMEAVGQTFTVL